MPTPTPQPERRLRPRAIADFTVAIETGGREIRARLRDLSESGFRCTVEVRLPVRATVTVRLVLPGSTDEHRLSAMVVRCAPGEGATPVVLGLRFQPPVPPIARAALRGYVQRGKRAP